MPDGDVLQDELGAIAAGELKEGYECYEAGRPVIPPMGTSTYQPNRATVVEGARPRALRGTDSVFGTDKGFLKRSDCQ